MISIIATRAIGAVEIDVHYYVMRAYADIDGDDELLHYGDETRAMMLVILMVDAIFTLPPCIRHYARLRYYYWALRLIDGR